MACSAASVMFQPCFNCDFYAQTRFLSRCGPDTFDFMPVIQPLFHAKLQELREQ